MPSDDADELLQYDGRQFKQKNPKKLNANQNENEKIPWQADNWAHTEKVKYEKENCVYK